MSSFLTLEEMKLWRSSTEKITLEEFAQRLGKSLNEKKETHDLYEIVKNRVEVPEQEIKQVKEIREIKEITEVKETKEVSEVVKISEKNVFRKELSSREEIIFNYFSQNKGRKISVGELAKLLNLPNSYVYKYIKNLREKLAQDVLVNADDGGYILGG